MRELANDRDRDRATERRTFIRAVLFRETLFLYAYLLLDLVSLRTNTIFDFELGHTVNFNDDEELLLFFDRWFAPALGDDFEDVPRSGVVARRRSFDSPRRAIRRTSRTITITIFTSSCRSAWRWIRSKASALRTGTARNKA